MKAWISQIAWAVFLSACATTTTTPQRATDEPNLFLNETAADHLSAAALVRKYVVDRDRAAVHSSSRTCTGQSPRGDSLVTALMNLPASGERTLDYALSWKNLLLTCHEPRIAAWYRSEIGKPQGDLTFQLLAKPLLRSGDPANIDAVKRAAFDTLNNPDARSALLNMFVEDLGFSGKQRVELMIESYRLTGEVPGAFVSNHAARLWALRTDNWREDLLAEIVAAPGKRGAPPLLLTIARETQRVPVTAGWRKTWEKGLEALERNRESSADLKAMIPIAREVAAYRND